MDQKINMLDFSRMHINIGLIGAGQHFLEVFPEYQHKPAYMKATDDEITVAILLCDRHGPFSRIKNYQERLNAIFAWRGYQVDGAQAELYESVLTLKNLNVADIWTEYLPAVFDHEWTSWFSNSVMYYQLMAQLRKPLEISLDGDNDKEAEIKWTRRMNMEKKADEIYKKMKDLEETLFLDESVKRRSAEREREKKIENFPEKFAVSNTVI